MNRCKKGVKVVLVCLFSLCAVVGALVVGAALGGRGYLRVDIDNEYYFLVKDCEETSVSAVAGDIYLSGGAGYYLEGENSVAIACYFKAASAESVKANLGDKGGDVRVFVRKTAPLTLKGKAVSARDRIVANAETADSLARLLYDTANGLEQAKLSQTEARSALVGAVSSLGGLIAENGEGVFSLWNTALKEAQRRGVELIEGLLFQKDIRYLQTLLCDRIVNIAEYFV